MVLDEGLTTMLAPVKLPGFQVYEVAPVADKDIELPAHKVGDAGEILRIGMGLTVCVTTSVEVQPKAFTPTTE